MPCRWAAEEDVTVSFSKPGRGRRGNFGRSWGKHDAVAQTVGYDEFEPNEDGYRSAGELAADARDRILNDRQLQEAFDGRLAQLSECLAGARAGAGAAVGNTSSEGGNPTADMEEAAAADDVAADDAGAVERVLLAFLEDVLGSVWRHTVVENTSRLRDLSRHSEALRQKVDTLTHHLRDRSKMLSDCRYAYFVEITHLRNQVYIKSRQGQSFKPTEAYFFDPTDFLEEELREMLNEKIRLSVKVIQDKLTEARWRIEDLEARLEQQTALATRPTTVVQEVEKPQQPLNLTPALKNLCAKFGPSSVVEELAVLEEKALREWAQALWRRLGRPDDAELAELERERKRSQQAQQALAELEAERARSAIISRDKVDKSVQAVSVESKAKLSVDPPPVSVVVEPAVDPKILREHAEALACLREVQLELEGESQKRKGASLPQLSAWAADCLRRQSAVLSNKKAATSQELELARQASEEALSQAQAHATYLEEELELLKRQLREAQELSNKQRQELQEVNERMFQLIEDQKPEEDVRRQSASDGFACADGRFERASQTNLATAGGGGFHLFEVPPAEAQLGIRLELEDLRSCATGIWEATLEHIRASHLPPHGHGSGACTRGSFIRLFKSAKQSLSRLDDLLAILEGLKRAEIQNVIEGVKFLMESSLPDSDAALRDAIFGRGLNEAAIRDLRGWEFTLVARRIARRVGTIIDILFQGDGDVELGRHYGRRIFVPTTGEKFHGGGAGGGLYARSLRDSSPPPKQLYAGVGHDGVINNGSHFFDEPLDVVFRNICGTSRRVGSATTYTLPDVEDETYRQHQRECSPKIERGGTVGGGYVTGRYRQSGGQRPLTAPDSRYVGEPTSIVFPNVSDVSERDELGLRRLARSPTNAFVLPNAGDSSERDKVGLRRRARSPTRSSGQTFEGSAVTNLGSLSQQDVLLIQPQSRALQPRRLADISTVADEITGKVPRLSAQGARKSFPAHPEMCQGLPQAAAAGADRPSESAGESIITENLVSIGEANGGLASGCSPKVGLSTGSLQAKTGSMKTDCADRPSTAPSGGRLSMSRLLHPSSVVAKVNLRPACPEFSQAKCPPSPEPGLAIIADVAEPQEEPGPFQDVDQSDILPCAANPSSAVAVACNVQDSASAPSAAKQNRSLLRTGKPLLPISAPTLEVPGSGFQLAQQMGPQQKDMPKASLADAAAEKQLRRVASAGRVRPAREGRGRQIGPAVQPTGGMERTLGAGRAGSSSDSSLPLMHIMSLPKAVAALEEKRRASTMSAS